MLDNSGACFILKLVFKYYEVKYMVAFALGVIVNSDWNRSGEYDSLNAAIAQLVERSFRKA